MKNNILNIIGLAHMTGVPALNRKELVELLIPIPSLEEQKRVVSILDRFDTLVNDITQGLPAEIAARRKQYEYYRDKLLTFREKSS
jgi:type I restriction enzyme S subunit